MTLPCSVFEVVSLQHVSGIHPLTYDNCKDTVPTAEHIKAAYMGIKIKLTSPSFGWMSVFIFLLLFPHDTFMCAILRKSCSL